MSQLATKVCQPLEANHFNKSEHDSVILLYRNHFMTKNKVMGQYIANVLCCTFESMQMQTTQSQQAFYGYLWVSTHVSLVGLDLVRVDVGR